MKHINHLFDIHGSVHRKSIFKCNQQDETLHNLFISVKCSTCFTWFLRPSSVAQNCIQGVTGGTDQTSGECSLGQTIPI